MKLILILGLVFPLFQLYLAESRAENRVKVVAAKTDFANTSYVALGVREVIIVNDTFNRLYMKAEIIKEFPLDTQFDVTVAIFKRRSQTEQIANFTTFICRKDDPNRKYLPYNLIDMGRTDGKNCVQKGDYEYEDAGIFKFYEKIPVQKGSYYQSTNILRSNDIVISKTRVTTEGVQVWSTD